MDLPSWKNTPTKQVILDFVAVVTNESNPDYVPPTERIACFDNDGTLWCEHPVPPQIMTGMDGLALAVEQDPALAELPLVQAAVAKDLDALAPYMSNEGTLEMLDIMLGIAAGETQAELEARISAWLVEARHPRFGVPYTQMIFQPMLELLDYLRANDFRVFIVSGGGMDYMRIFSEEVYGVLRENVIGANFTLSWEYRDGSPVLVRQAEMVEPYCDGPGKPINIQLHIGRPPILVGGNSNGDIEMMEFAAASGKPYLNLLLRHDDAEREYDSDFSSERAQETARERHWTIISMKDDFKVVFPY